tara:strand:+ start:267 stop:464 length:198 start_codon:yes stop_codon:yes gene_type:complete
MEIKNAKYVTEKHMDDNGKEKDIVVSVSCMIDGVGVTVPMDENNMHYAEILKQVEEKTLTIADAD